MLAETGVCHWASEQLAVLRAKKSQETHLPGVEFQGNSS